MVESKKKIIIIDGMNLFFRCFRANPDINESGYHFGGVVGFLKSLFYYCRFYHPYKIYVVFDGFGGSSYRKKIIPSYKKGASFKLKYKPFRPGGSISDTEEFKAFDDQLSRLKNKYLPILPFTTIQFDYIECDDVINYIVKYKDSLDYNFTIVSSDSDYFQLVKENVEVLNPFKKVVYNSDKVYEEFGVYPINFDIYKTFIGDKSDGIPGIKGLGKKTIFKYFPELSSKEKISLQDIKHKCEENIQKEFYKNILNEFKNIEKYFKAVNLDEAYINTYFLEALERIINDSGKKIFRFDYFKIYLKVDNILNNFNNVDNILIDLVNLH